MKQTYYYIGLILVIIIVLIMPIKGKGQTNINNTPDTAFTFSIKSGLSYGDLGGTVVEWSDSTIEIIGDTVLAFKAILSQLKEGRQRSEELYDFIQKTVDWINTVPDHYRNPKTNWRWLLVYRKLIKFGFIPIKNKH